MVFCFYEFLLIDKKVDFVFLEDIIVFVVLNFIDYLGDYLFSFG